MRSCLSQSGVVGAAYTRPVRGGHVIGFVYSLSPSFGFTTCRLDKGS